MSTENLPVQLSQPVLENLGLPVKKQQEILELIVAIDEKAKGWQQLAELQIEGPQDLQGIKEAGANRLTIKRERREAMNFLDAKRKQVQDVMAEYTMEDKAYLRLSQFYEKLGKEVEASLEEKEKVRERYEAEQRAKLREERLATLEEVCDTPEMYPVDSMSEEAFNQLCHGLRLAKEKAEQEEALRLEAEEKRLLEEKRVAEELAAKRVVFAQRKEQMAPYFGVQYEGKGTITLDTSEEEYQTIFIAAVAALDQHEKELEKLRQEKIVRVAKDAKFKIKQKQLFDLGLVSNGVDYLYKSVRIGGVSDFNIETSDEDFASAMEKIPGVIKQIDDAEKEAQEALAKQQEEARILREKAAKEAREAAEKQRLAQLAEEAAKKNSGGVDELALVKNWLNGLETQSKFTHEIKNNLELSEIVSKFGDYLAWANKKIKAVEKNNN